MSVKVEQPKGMQMIPNDKFNDWRLHPTRVARQGRRWIRVRDGAGKAPGSWGGLCAR